MRLTLSSAVVAFIWSISAPGLPALAQEDEPEVLKPEYWAVTGVSSGDVLNIRDVPSADSRSLGGIPPDAHGVKNLGCRRNELSLDRWMKANESQRQEAKMIWCRVQFHGLEGWVAGRFLKEDIWSAPAKPVNSDVKALNR
jgi:hypothetical protein